MSKVITHLKTLLPLPKAWTGEERTFGLKLEDAYKDLQALRNSLIYQKGTTVTISNMYGYGYSFNSAKSVRIVVPLDKLLPSGTYSIKSLRIVMRSKDGNVQNRNEAYEYAGSSSYSIATYRGNNGRVLYISLTKSTEFTNLESQVPVTTFGSMSFVIS